MLVWQETEDIGIADKYVALLVRVEGKWLSSLPESDKSIFVLPSHQAHSDNF